MDTLKTYQYALGSPRGLQEGEFDNLTITDDVASGLAIAQCKSSLTLPQFIGVYQREEVILDSNEEGAREAMMGIYAEKQRVTLRAARGWLHAKGVRDVSHADLIHVIYDEKALWNKGLVKECFKGNTDRIAFSPISRIPNFYEKEVILHDMLVEDHLQRLHGETNFSEAKKAIEEKLDQLAQQKKLYGLTTREYFLLLNLEGIYKESSPLITGGGDILSLLGFKEKEE